MIAKTWPKLYKQTATKKIQEWEIWVEDYKGSAFITVKWGQKDGEKQQTVTEIGEGKNLGKANETTYLQQAISEAESIWKKKQDKGYRLEIADTAEAIKFLPMLAKSFKDHSHKIVYPCYVQPKLDGLRCLAICDGKGYQLLSRQSKNFNTVNHIKDELSRISLDKDVVFDGELYVHNTEFQDIISAIKRDDPKPESANIEYHIYDCFFLDKPEAANQSRQGFIDSLLRNHQGKVKLVRTWEAMNEDQIHQALQYFEGEDYEGAIIRNKAGKYEQNRRSHNLQKLKSFEDAEFNIIDVKAGKGKFADMGIFTCSLPNNKPPHAVFDCMCKGTEEQRKQFLTDKDKLIGKILTVKFFGYSKENVPRFPVGVAVRDYE